MEKLVGVGASPGIAIGVAHVLASRVEIHERRIAAEQVDAELRRFERALHGDRRAAGAHPGADRRARGRRAAVPDPRGPPPDAVRRPPGRARAPDDPRRQGRGRVGGAQVARPDPGGVRAHRGSVLPRSQERRRARRRAPAAQPGRRRRLRLARGGAEGEHRHRARAVAGRRRPAGPRRGGGVLHRGRRPHVAHGDRGAGAGPALRRRRRGARDAGSGRG